VNPRALLAGDGRIYATANNRLGRRGLLVSDTLGAVAVVPGQTAYIYSPVVTAEAGDRCLYGYEEDGGMLRWPDLVSAPLGSVSRFGATPQHGRVDLTWAPVFYGTLSYRVERTAAGSSEFTQLAEITQTGFGDMSYRDTSAVPGTGYSYRVGCRMGATGAWNYTETATAAAQERAFLLAWPAPNPSRITTRVDFEVPARGRVVVEVFNVAGARVRTLLDEVRDPGPGSVTWDGCDMRGALAPTGMYFVRLSAAGRSAARKVLRFR
jgi:hypothetical protein